MSSAGHSARATPLESAPEIMIVISQFEVGGTETHVLELARALVRMGWRVTVYCLARNGPMRASYEQSGATILVPTVDTSDGLKSFLARVARIIRVSAGVLRELNKRRPAIVHIFLPAAYVVAAPMAILSRSPIRIMSRRSLNVYRNHRPLVWWLEQRLHRWMTAILGNSRSVLRELRDQEGVPELRLGLIYNGVNTERFNDHDSGSAMRAKLGLAESTFVMVIVANLIAHKGHRDLIEALGIAAPKLPADWCVLMVGQDYGISGALREQARALGLESNIVFLGMRDDVPGILQAADVGLLCSHEEGFSNAILEGMAAGLPMIVTSVGGNPEAVVDEETGIVVPPRDPPSLARAIVRLAEDAGLRAKFSAAARRRVTEKFSLEQSVASYDALYRALLAGGLPRDVPQVQFSDAAQAAASR